MGKLRDEKDDNCEYHHHSGELGPSQVSTEHATLLAFLTTNSRVLNETRTR